MSFLSNLSFSDESRLVDLSRYSDEQLHCLMDSATNEMARRASVNASRRDMIRRLENLAESEELSLDEIRSHLRGR